MKQTADSIRSSLTRAAFRVLFGAIRDYLHGHGERKEAPIGDLKRESIVFLFDSLDPELRGSFAWHCEIVGIDADPLQEMIKLDRISPSVKRSFSKYSSDYQKTDNLFKNLKNEVIKYARERRNPTLTPGLGEAGLRELPAAGLGREAEAPGGPSSPEPELGRKV